MIASLSGIANAPVRSVRRSSTSRNAHNIRQGVGRGIRRLVLVLVTTLVPRAIRAQSGGIDAQCKAGTLNERITQDLCQKALDVFQFMAPQLATTLVGGNAVAGQHSTLRGLGHLSVGVRANGLKSSIPRVEQRVPALTGATKSDFPVKSQWIGAPVVDAAIGIFRGIPFAGTYALGFDALVNVAYVPSVHRSDLSLEIPDGSLKFGFGGRLGLLAETFATPGLSLTWLQRDLPTLNLDGSVGVDELHVRDVRMSTTAWRLVAGKNLSFFSVAVGGGRDHYDSRASAQVTINRVTPSVTSSVVSARQELTRTNAFANVAFNLAALRLAAEVGRVSGGSIATYNTFTGHVADEQRNYASLGLRVNW